MLQSPEIEFEHDDFEFETIDEELLVDGRCQQILKQFYLFLQQQGMVAEKASELAFSADLYLRDYLIDFGRQNIVRPDPGIITKFAGSWFITHTLDPDFTTLERHLTAISELYGYMHRQHLISADELSFLLKEAGQAEFYRQRIDSFLNLTGAGFAAWDAECPAVL
ncbi:MAG: hypothetical protein PHP95_14765 [Desulfuromonadaceae bacterium]|nr:hypothetical protein [Desulfuromonadaceae bacterium]MDD2849712.1 hypothetical protein [Desulfuromonadaceae bacterium]MDD4129815.1 hypothetical protein [Desulfuromonadaceae bacterium]